MKRRAAEGQTGYSVGCVSAGKGGGIPVTHGETLLRAETSLKSSDLKVQMGCFKKGNLLTEEKLVMS